jgi:chaperonin GroEL (HSP60 family)
LWWPWCINNYLIFASQLENYAKTEEAKVEELIKAVAETGAKVIVSGAAVGEMALHFCERYKYASFLPCGFVLFFL